MSLEDHSPMGRLPRPESPRPTRRSLVKRIALMVAAGWLVWFGFQRVWVRVCVHRIAGSYQTQVNAATGQVTGITFRPGTDQSRLQWWQTQLAEQSPRLLLPLLSSKDTVTVYVAAESLKTQLIYERR